MAEWIDLLDPDQAALAAVIPEEIHPTALTRLLAEPQTVSPHHDDEQADRSSMWSARRTSSTTARTSLSGASGHGALIGQQQTNIDDCERPSMPGSLAIA